MENLEINIQEFAFLIGWSKERASEYFKNICGGLNIKYERKMKLAIKILAGLNKEATKKLVEKAKDINENYFRRYEKRLKMLNDKKCIEKQTWIGENAAVKVFLNPSDVEAIESNWKQKKQDFYSQQGLFGVSPILVAPRKARLKTSERKVANPN